MSVSNNPPPLDQIVLKLRDDLRVVPQQEAGGQVYILENPATGKFFRLGTKEYLLAKRLDGRRSLRQLLESSAIDPPTALSEEQALTICQWLVEMELAHPTAASQADRVARTVTPPINPLSIRWRLGSPDRWLTKLAPSLRWFFSPLMTLVTAVAGLIAVISVAGQWDRFGASTERIFAGDQHVSLLLSWMVVKLLHELAHGVTCKMYGGFVREAGVQFILFTPSPYVDVTSSWRFPSKWQRIHVAAAGMLMEFLIAALATLLWNVTASGALNQLAAQIVVIASVSTLLFNANPLMRFDGYYILSDLLEFPNLATVSQQHLHERVRKLIGLPLRSRSGSMDHSLLVPLYGVGALVWRWVTILSLVIAAVTWLGSFGWILVGISFLQGSIGTVRSARRWLLEMSSIQRRNAARVFATGSGVALLVVLVAFVLPSPAATRAPGIVEYAPLHVVRAESAGMVRTVLVRDGEAVAAGQVLATLENRALADEWHTLRLAVEQSAARARSLQQRHELAAFQAEEKQREALISQAAEKQRQLERMTLVAPAAGKVVRRDLETLLGQYLTEGQEFCTVANESQKEVRAVLDQNDLAAFAGRVNRPVTVFLSKRRLSVVLARIDPRASRDVPHEALTAPHGGPLAVRVADDSTTDRTSKFELLEPHFAASIALDAAQSQSVHAGQRCFVVLTGTRHALGTSLFHACRDWLRSRFNSSGSNDLRG